MVEALRRCRTLSFASRRFNYGRPSRRSERHATAKREDHESNKALWEKGDFTRIAESMRESGEELVQKLGVTKGMKVLDLGCGDGTTALPEAKLGADVLGVDIAANLVEAGNSRAKEAAARQLPVQEATPPTCMSLRRQFRSRREHLRGHVRAQAF